MSAEYEAFREIIAHRKLAPQRERVTAMRQSGMAERAIADELGVNLSTVHYALAFWGVKPKAKVQHRRRRLKGEIYCSRCKILLAHAPQGKDGVCGWCLEEILGRSDPEHGISGAAVASAGPRGARGGAR